MYREIAQFDDKRQLPPGGGIDGEAEGRLMDEGLEVVLVRHLHRLVRRIDPLYRQFQRFSAADSAESGGGGVDGFGVDAGGGEEGVVGGEEKEEVGHTIHLLKSVLGIVQRQADRIYQF